MSITPSSSLPACIEVFPGTYTPLGECTREQITAEAASRLTEAQSLFDVAAALVEYLETGVGL